MPKTRIEIAEAIISIVEKKGPVPGDVLEDKLSYQYIDTGHIDSFSIVNFILEIEETFCITISAIDSESAEFRTLGGLVEIVFQKLKT